MSEDTGDLKARIRAYIEHTDHVSFAELRHRFEEMNAPNGEGGWILNVPGVENVCLWCGLTEAASEAFIELIAEKVIHPVPCRSLIYAIDRGIPNMPILMRVPNKRPLKELHWLPTVLRPGPPPKTKAARKRAMAGAA